MGGGRKNVQQISEIRQSQQLKAYPTTNGGMQNGRSVGICIRCIHVFEHLAPICMLSRCLLTKISASEPSRKFIESALLVGYWLHVRRT